MAEDLEALVKKTMADFRQLERDIVAGNLAKNIEIAALEARAQAAEKKLENCKDNYELLMMAAKASETRMKAAEADADRLADSLTTIVGGLREGWWGEGSGELEEGELQQAEDRIDQHVLAQHAEAVRARGEG